MNLKGSIRIRNEKYSYYFKYKDENGKWRTKEKGGFKTKKEAEKAMRKAITDFEENNFIENVVKASDYTLSQYIDYWFENVGDLSLKYNTLLMYRKMHKLYIKGDLGELKLDKVTPNILQNFFTNLQKKYSKSTVNATRNLISNTLNLALKQGIIKRNSMKSIKLASSKKSKNEIRALNEAERSFGWD